jgi:hypothetical protein
MDPLLSALPSVLSSATVRAWRSLVNSLHILIAIDVRTYKPEKYYMRGPGPKWREKHAHGRASAPR